MKLHGYYWDPNRLKDLLKPFINGQFWIQTKYGEILRGEISNIQVLDNVNKKSIKLKINWLCRKNKVFDEFVSTKTKWIKVGSGCTIDIDYLFYYFQEDENRVKVRTSMGEVCRFYMADDYTSLVKIDDKFIPLCLLREREFKMAMYICLEKSNIDLKKI